MKKLREWRDGEFVPWLKPNVGAIATRDLANRGLKILKEVHNVN
ncbi:hypothetical protein [Sulfolobus sp. B1]|nr:hypothetical protein [Sulfolobus sp. B1]